MSEHDSEKRKLEKAAIELFVRCFKGTYGVGYRLVEQRERPDAIVVDENGNGLGLEVTHLYYDVLEAKMLLCRSEQKRHGKVSGPENFDDYIKVLNSILAQKLKTVLGYSTEYPCSLLIRNASPIWTKEDFVKAIAKIYAPKSQYKDIWLLTADRSSAWSLIRLG